jgi:uncharacterized cupin superfamily protein
MSDRVYETNIWTERLAELGDGVSAARLLRSEDCPLVAGVWELAPGATLVYHLHHGTDEYLIVLRGRLTLRTPDGERQLGEGDVAPFPRGLAGAHGFANETDEPVRYVVAAYHGSPEVIEYPDEGRMVVGAETPGADGERLFREIT